MNIKSFGMDTKRTVQWPACFLLILLLVQTGCQTAPQHTALLKQLAAVDPHKHSLAADTPIIDVHTHTFNARDLPVQNITLGRRDVYPPWTWLISDDTAKFLAAVLVSRTDPEPGAELLVHRSKSNEQRVTEAAQAFGTKPAAVATFTNRPQFTLAEKALRYSHDKEAPRLSFKERVALRAISYFLGHKGSISRRSIQEILAQFSPFLADFTLSDAELLEQFYKENSTNVAFRLSHMMDMGPTYGQRPGEAGMRSFKEEVRRIADLQKQESARMTYFVAYNPFRDNSQKDEALRVVEDAIRNHCAYGVKVYPPAGYRPISNNIPSRPFSLLSGKPGLQWDARYKKDGVRLTNSELDRRLLALLRWCATNNIPVFVHSGYGEMQARGGYGQDMPNPHWWGLLLDNGGKDFPELRNLRLCFGHSGGADGFFGDNGFKAWSDEVCCLCRRYPNVYCEVGCLDQILNTNKQAVFAQQMKYLCNLPTDSKHPYAFSSKIMYGSDWYMPITGGGRPAFLRAFQQVFLLPELQCFYKQFFLNNALAYLDVERRLASKDFPIDPVVASMLQKLSEKAGLPTIHSAAGLR